jgi:hypothetical protein
MIQAITFLVVIVFGCYLAVRLAASAIAGLGGSRHRAYRMLAHRRGGRYESRGMSDPPTVSFPHRGSTVRVGLAPVVAGQPTSPRTRVVARFAEGLPIRFELFPVARPAPAQPPKGTRPVRSGHAEFDRIYLARANDPEMAKGLLEPFEVRRAIDALRQLAPPSGMLISINPERMLAQVDRNLALHPGLLDAAVREVLILHDWLLATVATRMADGIDIVADGAAAVDRAAGPLMCIVCGDPILAAHVVCVHCKTPHHRDCWMFIGACSTFGCQGKVSVPA